MSKRPPTSTRLHRRETRRMIVLPFLGGVALLFVLVTIAALSARTGAIADVLVMLVLCPLALCLLPLYFMLFALIGITGRLHDGLANPLRRLGVTTESLRTRAAGGMERAARASIAWNVRFAWLDRLVFSLFDEPTKTTTQVTHPSSDINGGENHGTSS